MTIGGGLPLSYELLEGDPKAHPKIVKIEVRQLGIPKVVIVNRPNKEGKK